MSLGAFCVRVLAIFCGCTLSRCAWQGRQDIQRGIRSVMGTGVGARERCSIEGTGFRGQGRLGGIEQDKGQRGPFSAVLVGWMGGVGVVQALGGPFDSFFGGRELSHSVLFFFLFQLSAATGPVLARACL